MSNYPMVDEVNRLVGNLLAAGSGVFLPGVGSLFVERRGAGPAFQTLCPASLPRGILLFAAAGGIACR